VTAPPPYPRIAHLVPGRGGTGDDRVLPPGRLASFLERPVLVEEKLDGANVMLWLEDDVVRSSLRAGPGALDRAGQLGALRAWVGPRSDQLRALLSGELVLYAEWLHRTHSIRYDRLPSYLIGLDLRSAGGRFLGPGERDERFDQAGIDPPPELARGVTRSVADLDALAGLSRFGHEAMEGVVVRSLDGTEPRIAKLLRAGFVRVADHAWGSGRNVVAPDA